MGPELDPNLAALIDTAFETSMSGTNLKEIVKKHPCPSNTFRLVAPLMEPEVKAAVQASKGDSAAILREDNRLLYLQQDLVTVGTILARFANVQFERDDADPELEEIEAEDAFNMLAQVLND